MGITCWWFFPRRAEEIGPDSPRFSHRPSGAMPPPTYGWSRLPFGPLPPTRSVANVCEEDEVKGAPNAHRETEGHVFEIAAAAPCRDGMAGKVEAWL